MYYIKKFQDYPKLFDIMIALITDDDSFKPKLNNVFIRYTWGQSKIDDENRSINNIDRIDVIENAMDNDSLKDNPAGFKYIRSESIKHKSLHEFIYADYKPNKHSFIDRPHLYRPFINMHKQMPWIYSTSALYGKLNVIDRRTGNVSDKVIKPVTYVCFHFETS